MLRTFVIYLTNHYNIVVEIVARGINNDEKKRR